MRIKDYYKTLDLKHTATSDEIKRAYRQLAMRYHPDKNSGNEYSTAHFREIKEAYQVLSHPARRSAYNQQRWYRKSSGMQYDHLTPHSVLKKSIDLNRYLGSLDPFRINKHSLFEYIMHLLRDSTVKLLLDWNDTSVNTSIIAELLKASTPLSFKSMERVGARLIRLAGTDNDSIETIHRAVKERRVKGYWHKYHELFILLITLVLCWLIYKIGN